ncbi:MAG TPA: large conductance mechanosensitive channel protein MscL [Acidimicrobiia bacterium]|nr:large conductance mechanosensitive channel protein MscL [Acidimicrobiia bacterium]
MKVLKEFKDFITKGSLIELAVAFVIAVAFGAVIKAFVDFVIMPLISAIVGKPSFDDLVWTLNDAVIPYGMFITALVTFVLVAAAVFFFVVRPYNSWKERKAAAEEATPEVPAEEIVLLREIRDRLGR